MAAPTLPVEISFADGPRPEESTHVRTDFFDGPLALLLALIEQRQLDVLTVRLGDLAGAYLDAIARIEHGRLGLLSSFVTVCSQPCSRSTPSMINTLLPMPEIFAPIRFNIRQSPCTCGSPAAFWSMVVPLASTAARTAFSVAMTLASSKKMF